MKMIDIIKENVDKEIKDKAISKYEDKLKEIDKYVDDKINDIIKSIQDLKNIIKYDIVTEEISAFYVDEKSLALDELYLDDDIESEELIKEIDNFALMNNNDVDYIIEDNIMKLFQWKELF